MKSFGKWIVKRRVLVLIVSFALLVPSVMVEGMSGKEATKLKSGLEAVEHVDSIVWYDTLFDGAVPMKMLPDKYYEIFNEGDATLMAVFFDTSTSADGSRRSRRSAGSPGRNASFPGCRPWSRI